MKEASHHYQIPAEPGRLRALSLALLVHLLLLGFLSDRRRFTAADMVAVVAEMQDEWSTESAVVQAQSDRF